MRHHLPGNADGYWTTCNIPFSSTLKNENFVEKNKDIFNIFAQNIDCGYMLEPHLRGDSNEYPQSIFWTRNKKKIGTAQQAHGIRVTSDRCHDVALTLI